MITGSASSAFTGRIRLAAMRRRNLAVHWPEGNVLLSAARRDARSGEPDYNLEVRVERP